MREGYDVLIQPLVTEKTTGQMEAENVYTFIVAKNANKIEIGSAIERMWDVSVKHVRTMRYPGKERRSHMSRLAKNPKTGRRPSFKKAVVKLAEGDHIELYEVG